MPNEIEAYLIAREESDAAQREVERLISVIRKASRLLRNWRDVRVLNVPVEDLGYPAELSFNSTRCIDAIEWPSSMQISQALVNWHSASQRVMSLWSAIPLEHRSGTMAPDA